MKVDIDYSIAHEAIRKIQKKEALTEKENDVVLTILTATIGDYIPSEEELERQMRNVRLLDNINPANTNRWDNVMKDINGYESKYC